MNGVFCVAVHALIYLDKRNCMLSSEELAANICTNPARVRRVMSKLKKAGLVTTKTGNEGGYHLLCKAGEITLKEIADALEVRFVELAWHSGGTDLPCMVASGMAEVMDGLFDDLDQRCRDRMAQLRLSDLETQLEHAAARKEMTHGL